MRSGRRHRHARSGCPIGGTCSAAGARRATSTATTALVLLGTAGGSNPKSTRSGYANAVVVGDAAYLVDCGEGAHSQLWRAGLTLNHNFGRDRPLVRSVFVTHLHADHLMDLANLFLGSWPPQVVDVYGPSPAGLPIASFPPDAVATARVPRRPHAGHRGPPPSTCCGPSPTTSTSASPTRAAST